MLLWKVLSNLMYPPVHDLDNDSPIAISEAADRLEVDEDEVCNLIHRGALGADPDCEQLYRSDVEFFLSTLVLE